MSDSEEDPSGGSLARNVQRPEPHVDEALLRSLIDDMPACVAIIDRQGAILLTNQAWNRFAAENGLDSLDAVGWGVNYVEVCRRAVGPRSDEARECQERLERLLNGELDHFDMEYPCHSPERQRWFILHAAAFRHEHYYAILSHIEITRSKLIEQELRQSRQMLQLVLDTIPVRVFWKDRESRYLGCNMHFAQDAGQQSPADLVGKVDYDFNWREQAEAYRADDKLVIQTGQVKLNYEEPLRTSDGRLIWLRTSKAPLRDPDGSIIGVLGTYEDITERKLAEQQMRERIVEQARAIAERQQAEEALREADRRKDEFLAMLSHELRNPLAPIRNAVHILKSFCDTSCENNEQTQRQREIIERQVSHMARLLDDLLDVSRITRGKIQLKRERLDLRAVIEGAIDTLRPQIAGREQHLSYTRPDAPLWVDGDPTRLEQILGNLIHNAVKYSNSGGRIWIEVAAHPGRGQAAVGVRDEGIGIAPDVLPRIFDLFTQASQSLDRAQGGLGIGLTLVQKLVVLHGGSIEAASPGLGLGSVFTMRLPLALGGLPSDAALVPREPAAAAPAKPHADHPTRVLVVDDIVDTATSLAEILRIWGYQVSIAFDGPKALETARDFTPDIVILDLGLPGMDGFEVARRMRREPGLDRARLIAMTGYSSDEDRRRALEAGFNQHLAKPVDMARLQEVLAQGHLTFEI